MYYIHRFGYVCYILNDKEHLGKFDSRCDERMFLGYASNNTSYRVYNKKTGKIKESINSVFDDHHKFSTEDFNDLSLNPQSDQRGNQEAERETP